MKRTLSLLILSIGLLVCPIRAQRERPNFVLILLDDVDYHDIYGENRDTLTPNIDRLTSEGMALTQYYATPVCSPSRAGLLTGQPASFGFTMAINDELPERIDADKRGVPAEFEMIPETLDGYDTAHVGKWHMGTYREEFRPESRFGQALRLDQGYDAQEAGNTPFVTDQAIGYLGALQAPFFLNIWMYAPHKPFHVPPDFDNSCCGFDLGTERGQYEAMLYDVDAHIGRIVEAVPDNTLVIVASDNGGEFPNMPGRWLRDGKRSVYEGGIRVPFVAWWPGVIPAGTVNDSIASNLDVFPTLAELAGGVPPNTPGRSLAGVLTQDTERKHYPFLFWEVAHYNRYHAGQVLDFAVRRGDHKLVGTGDKLELYNLADDPGEQNDLAALHSHRVEWLYGKYLDWRRDTGDLSTQADNGVIPFEVRQDFHNGDFSAVVRFEGPGSVARDGSWRLEADESGAALRIEGDGGSVVELASGPLHFPAAVMFTVTGYKLDYNHFQLYVNGHLVDEVHGEDSVYAVASGDADIVMSGSTEVQRLSVMVLSPEEVDWQQCRSWLPVVMR